MLTLILLVVLGGGAGLLAVWLIDARGLSGLFDRLGGRSLRRTRRRDTARAAVAAAPGPAVERRFEPLVSPVSDARSTQPEPLLPSATTTVRYEPVQAPFAPLATASRHEGARVPPAFTAVEGSYRDVALAPLWRKVVSLVSLLVILVAAAATVAALAGATFGAIAELIDGAIG